MKEIPPDTVSNFTAFPPLPYPYSGAKISGKSTFGHVSRDGTWAWVARDSMLDVFTTSAKERYGSWCFGAVLNRSDHYVITAVEELCSRRVKFPCLLVAVDKGDGDSILCMFNPRASKIVKVIEIPYKITSINVVSSEGGASVETNPLCDTLRCMFGMVAIGTQHGRLFLLDLCLDEKNFSNEISPSTVTFITRSSGDVPEKRKFGLSVKHHLCLLLNGCHMIGSNFEYHSTKSVLATFNGKEIYVSALKYLPKCASLAVGFNFGGIQIWNLQYLCIEQSFAVHSFGSSPVVKFEFQEPENDPREFCFLWVIKGHYEGENCRPCRLSIATLYSLTFRRKMYCNNFGYLYEGLLGCSKRFDHILSNDPFSPIHNKSLETSSRLIMSRVLRPIDSLSRNDADENALTEELIVPDELSLFAMAWEVWPQDGNAPTAAYLTFFDINQWYRAQMPSALRYDNGDFCSYLGVFSLQAVRSKLNSGAMLDVNIVRSSILKFKCLTVVDEFFYPSALAFRTCCLTIHGALNASYVGSQRQLLNDMTRAGPNCLIEPRELYNNVLVNGLLNHMQDSLAIRHLSLPMQREALLTMALEHNMCYFLNTCVISWNTNRYAQVGLTVQIFLEWAWKRIAHIKMTSDRLCQPLFNCSGQGMDKNSLQHLLSYQSQLKRVSCILFAFQKSPDPKTESVKQELALRISVVHTIDLYLHAITFLYYARLLPEHAEDVLLKEQDVAYPFTRLKVYYSKRRSELQKLHSSIGPTDILLVDGLMAEMGSQIGSLFASKTGSELYPPPSIYAVIGSFLLEGASFLHKHQLLFYVILDMVKFLSDRQANISARLMKFPQAFNVSPSHARLTRGFWLLDHKNFEDALSTLLDSRVRSDDIAPWCHTRILKSFLYQGHPEKALNYMNYKNPPRNNIEDIKLHLTVLLANRCIGEAFLFQRKFQSEEHFEDLLNHLFDSCQQMNALSTLLKLPLSTVEHAALVNYLNNSSDPKLKEMLVMYYLLHCCPLDAAEVNEKLAAEIPEDDVKAQDNAKIRSALVSAYVKTLPEEQKVLAQEIKRMASSQAPSPKVLAQVKPEPLSVTITAQSMAAQSYADTLRRVMENISCISMGSSNATESRFTPNFVPFAPPIPFLRSPFMSLSDAKLKTPSKVVFPTPLPKRQGGGAHSIFDHDSPPKRARFMETLACRSLDPERRRSMSSMKAEVLSLLQTPTICRIAPQVHSPAPLEGSDGATPPSILKIAKSGNLWDLPMQAASVSSNDAETSVDESEDLICDMTIPEESLLPLPNIDDLQSKHLRFRDSSPQKSVSDSKVEHTIAPRSSQLSDHTFSSPSERSFRVSPRRPLRDSDISLSSDSSSSDISLAVKGKSSPTASSLLTTQNDSSNGRKYIVVEKELLMEDTLKKPLNVQGVRPDDLRAANDQKTDTSDSCEWLSPEEMSVITKLERAITSAIPPKFSTSKFAAEFEIKENKSLDTYNPPSMSGHRHGTKYRVYKYRSPSVRRTLTFPESSESTSTSTLKLEKRNISSELERAISSVIEPKSSTSVFAAGLEVEERKSLDMYNIPSMSGPYRGTRSRSRSSSDSVKDAAPRSMCEVLSPPQLFESSSTSPKKSEKKNRSSESGNTDVLEKSPFKGTLLQTTRSRQRPRKGSKFGEMDDEPEYSFSEPTVSGDPKISEALASPPIMPVPAFVFSPPLTRARLQMKKLSETMRNPYMSPNRKGKQLPVDPLLLDSSTLIPMESVISSTAEMSPHHSDKKSLAKKKKVTVHSQLTSSQRKSYLVSPLQAEQISPEINSHLNTARHSMRLRKAKVRRKSVKLW